MRFLTRKPTLQLKNGIVIARQAQWVKLVPLAHHTVTLVSELQHDGRFNIIAQSDKHNDVLLHCASEQEASRLLAGLHQPRLMPSIRMLVMVPIILFVGWFLFLLPNDDPSNLLPSRTTAVRPPLFSAPPEALRAAQARPALARPAQAQSAQPRIALPALGTDPAVRHPAVQPVLQVAPEPSAPKAAAPDTDTLSAFGLRQ